MVQSSRLKKHVREYMAAHPGVKYQQALDAVTAADNGGPPPPITVAVGSDYPEHIPDFFQVLGIDDIATHDFTAAWARGAETGSLRIPVGWMTRGDEITPEISFLDFMEENLGGNGPHGAVAGRTGSGKSYLLREIVLALAALYGPDTVSLAMIDFKGGATFLGLDKLPHTAAWLSNLDQNFDHFEQFLGMLSDEIDHREEFITTEKGCRDIHEYRKRRIEHSSENDWPPLPHLIVLVDEFGESLRNHAGCLQRLTRVARIGRSLGVHLLMGSSFIDRAVAGDLFEHLNYRISLSVNAPQHSIAMIGSDAAATMIAGRIKGRALRKFRDDTDPVEFTALHHEAKLPLADGGADMYITMADALIDRLAKLDVAPVADICRGQRAVQRKQITAVRAEIDALIGQDAVKEQLRLILASCEVGMEQRRRGLGAPLATGNFVFTGPPGVGKTHAAGILARILRATGAIESSEVVTANRVDLIGCVEGESAAKTRRVLDSARGGLLYIDEVYDLVQDRGGQADPFGTEALDEIVHRMHSGEAVVAVSGDSAVVDRFLSTHRHLRRQIHTGVEFTHFTADELWEHLLRFGEQSGRTIDPDSRDGFVAFAQMMCEGTNQGGAKMIDLAGNARMSRNVVSLAQGLAARRMAGSDLSALSDADLITLTASDIAAATATIAEQLGIRVDAA